MKDSVTVEFRDLETSDDALAIIRYDESAVAICLSLKSNGDVEVVMAKKDARALIDALTTAVNFEDAAD